MVKYMNNIKISFLITLLAGLSTLIGTLLIFTKKRTKIIPFSLSFASGVMFSISIIDLLPNAYINISEKYLFFPTILFILIFVSLGVVIDIILDMIIKKNNNHLYRLGILSMIALMIHNIPEGIVTFITSTNNISLGIMLSIAIALHNIPEGIMISVPIYYSTNSKKKAFLYTFISGMSEFLGALITFILFKNINSNYIIGFTFALIAGLMLHISIYEIPPIIKEYKDKRSKYFFILGIIIMMINHFLLG